MQPGDRQPRGEAAQVRQRDQLVLADCDDGRGHEDPRRIHVMQVDRFRQAKNRLRLVPLGEIAAAGK